MSIYLIGIIIFVIILIVCIYLLIYFIKDEDKLQEVTTETLKKYGKTYTKEEFEDKIFDTYTNILLSISYENYSFLKDSVSDELYNQLLLKAKQMKSNDTANIISDVKKDFCRLISYKIENDIEIAKFWTKYSNIEYVKGQRAELDEQGKPAILVDAVTQGSSEEPVNHEYILTFVKNKTETEDIVCPSCGFKTSILTSSNCTNCESEVIPKKKHWVFVSKVTTNISNNK